MNAQRKTTSGQRSTSRGCLTTIFGVIVVVALILGAAEFGVRYLITKQISDTYNTVNAQQQIDPGDGISISYGTSPVLPVLVTDTLPHMTIHTPSTLQITNGEATAGTPTITGDPASTIDMDKVSVANRTNPVAESMVITSDLPPELLQAMANSRTGAIGRISMITPNPAEGVFDVQFSSGLATAKFRPVVRDGGISMDIEGASLFGFDVDGVARLLGDAASKTLSSRIGHNLVVDDAIVTDAGLQLKLRGANIPLSTIRDIEYK